MRRYSNIEVIRNTNENIGNVGSRYHKPNYYPEIPLDENDIYIETEFGDRLDLLANQFYQDVTLYWIIAAANPNKIKFDSLFLPVGVQLRIPTNINDILNSYNNLNGS